MKKLVAFLITVSSLNAKAQLADLKTHDIVKDSIVSRYNRQDYRGIYDLADSSFKAGVSEKDMIAFLQNYSGLGKIASSSLLKQSDEGLEYRLQCPYKSIQLTLGVRNKNSYTKFGLDLYRLPAIRTRTNFKSDNPLKTELDSTVQKAVTKYMSNENVAGISIGVISDGNSYSYNFGEMKKRTNQLINNKTIYDIGSIAKVFTGILLANAVVENKLKLDDDIRKYLNGNFPNLQYDGTSIKIVHLANLTSRIPSEPTIGKSGITPLNEQFTSKFDDETLSGILSSIVVDTLPGTKREYSNFAPYVLSKILERVYGMTYEELLIKYIANPYKMRQTRITLSKNDKKNYAQGYSMDGTEVPYWKNDVVSPAGGIRSTVSDMLLFMKEQLNTNNKAAQLSHQLTFGTESDGNGRGLFWGISRTKSRNHLRWTHNGSSNGFSSQIWMMPEINAGIVILTNNGNYTDEAINSEILVALYRYLSSKK